MSNTIVPQILSELDGVEEIGNGSNTGNMSDEKPFFLSISGPEILNMWIGESERSIRDIYRSARDHSPYVVSIFATNRHDVIDPALLRPGRIDKKIGVSRPNEAAAKEIFLVHLRDGVPINDGVTEVDEKREFIADIMVKTLYNGSAPLALATLKTGKVKDIKYSDLMSGAKVMQIVRRASEAAFERDTTGEGSGLLLEDFYCAIDESFEEDGAMMVEGEPYKWSRILGRDADGIRRIERADRKKTQRSGRAVI